MRKYSFVALLLFIACAVFRILGIFFPQTSLYTALFYVLLLLALAFEALQSFSNSNYSSVFNGRDNFRLKLFAIFAGAGMFVDFVSCAVGIYKCAVSRSDTTMQIVLQVLLCLSALLACLCMLSCAMSFSDGNAYDFRKLEWLNTMPLAWLIIRCMSGLTDVYGVGDINSALMYLCAVLGVGAFYSFAYETQNDGGAKGLSVFCFNSFSACSGMAVLSKAVTLAHGGVSVDEKTVFTLSLLLAGTFTYSLGRNALNDSVY